MQTLPPLDPSKYSIVEISFWFFFLGRPHDHGMPVVVQELQPGTLAVPAREPLELAGCRQPDFQSGGSEGMHYASYIASWGRDAELVMHT